MNRTTPMPLHQLHLRVYEPLVAFPPEQRRAWTEYVAAHPPSNEDLVGDLYEEIVRANAIENGPRLPKERTPHAYIVHHEGQIMICPVQLRFRSLRAAEGRPDLFSPTGLAHEAAAALLVSLRREEQQAFGTQGRWDTDDGRVRARTAIWAAPVSWLLMFEPDDRVNPRSEQLLMRASVKEVISRLRAANGELEVMRGGLAPASSEVSELLVWLEQFHTKGVVELDYGGAVRSLLANGLLERDEDGLPYDQGPADLLVASDAVQMGDVKKAIAAYRNVYQRIRRAKNLAVAS